MFPYLSTLTAVRLKMEATAVSISTNPVNLQRNVPIDQCPMELLLTSYGTHTSKKSKSAKARLTRNEVVTFRVLRSPNMANTTMPLPIKPMRNERL